MIVLNIVIGILFVAACVAVIFLARRIRKMKDADSGLPQVKGNSDAEKEANFERLNPAKRLFAPLSLIKGALEDILGTEKVTGNVRSKLLVIEDGADNMLEVYNELFSQDGENHSLEELALRTFPEGFNIRADRMNEEIDSFDPDKPVVLVVEKDFNMRLSLTAILKKSFSTLSVPDSFEAHRVLGKHDVNLILCNSELDQIDGFELCQMIKEDMKYSHIPVVVYYPAGNAEYKLKSISVGADFSVEMPFSTTYMLAIVQNLLSIREKLRHKYASSPWLGVSAIALSKTDENFLTMLNKLIQANMEDPAFSVDDIAETMNVSRSTLYRKVMSLTNMSPNEFLGRERLKKAALLLKEGSDKINEISYKVGFSSSSYFSKCFQKQFGVLPKDYK